MKIQAIGADDTIENLTHVGQELVNAEKPMRAATLLVSGAAKRNAPVDTGVLRSSITPSVRSSGQGIVGVVGSNVEYAPYMELGTRPHWPPVAALETWARRHGISAFLVARAIAKRGLKARRYLQKAFQQNVGRINHIFEDWVRRITK